MLARIRQFFGKATDDRTQTAGKKTGYDILVAVCALLVEMAGIDGQFTSAELQTVMSILKEKYGLSQEDADALITEAERELKESVDLWQFATLINENYQDAEKIELIETLWRIVYVDGKMDRYEHYLMNKLNKLLRLPHRRMIEAKLKVTGSG
ncbi:MAG: TerB family tellurite resistance protein [Deltaproteobacteria bacterium]|nr:TerB family tellurite resistance protein [Deltaproteobacteria bacterium]